MSHCRCGYSGYPGQRMTFNPRQDCTGCGHEAKLASLDADLQESRYHTEQLEAEIARLRQGKHEAERRVAALCAMVMDEKTHSSNLFEEKEQLRHERDALLAELKQAGIAARKFVDKVESGRARSVETYADMKALLALPHLRKAMEGKC